MSALVSRAAAGVGWLAHGIGRLVGSIIWFAPRGIPWALIVAVLLAVGAWRSIEGARAATATQPRPEPVGLADVVDLRATGWVGTSSIVRGPFLDSLSYGASVQRWYYLLTDPTDDSVAMIARSTERLEERQTRTIVARVDEDRAAVSAAIADRDLDRLAVDPDRYLVELAERPASLTGDAVATPGGSGLDEPEVILRGAFADGRAAADGEGWEYLVSDGNRGVVIRSPYPPDELPVDIWGVPATDRLRTEQAAAVPGLRAELGNRELPERRLLAEGVTPPLAEITYLPAMVLAALSAILVIGWLIGYPIFRRHPLPGRVSTWPLQAGDELSADLFGTDRRGSRRVVVDGAPGHLALLAADDVDRRSWQFALRDPSVRTGDPAGSGILTLSSGEGPILVRLDAGAAGVHVVSGAVVRAGGSRPALRIRAAGLDLLAAFGSAADRDRAAVAIDPARAGPPPAGAAPPRAVERPQSIAAGRLPAPLIVAGAVLGAVGSVLLVGGAVGAADVVADPTGLVPTIGLLAVGAGFLAVARGVWLRRGWADGLGFNVSWIGAAIAAFLIVAAPGCGLWLTPNLVACQAVGPLGSVGALAAAGGLGYAALAIRRHASAFVR
ncbi:MAG: hypothetical protein ACT4OQ_06355 [Chloroflexota bacterium]